MKSIVRRLCVCFFVLVGALTLASCNDNEIDVSSLVGRWVIVSNAKDDALALYIDEETVQVHNSAYSYRPFTADCEWSYYVDRDSAIHLSRYVGTDSDGNSEYEYLDFTLSFKDSYNTMELYYEPLFGSIRRFTFMRRR